MMTIEGSVHSHTWDNKFFDRFAVWRRYYQLISKFGLVENHFHQAETESHQFSYGSATRFHELIHL